MSAIFIWISLSILPYSFDSLYVHSSIFIWISLSILPYSFESLCSFFHIHLNLFVNYPMYPLTSSFPCRAVASALSFTISTFNQILLILKTPILHKILQTVHQTCWPLCPEVPHLQILDGEIVGQRQHLIVVRQALLGASVEQIAIQPESVVTSWHMKTSTFVILVVRSYEYRGIAKSELSLQVQSLQVILRFSPLDVELI